MSESKNAAKGNECLFCAEENRKTLAFDVAGDRIAIEIDNGTAAIESDSMGFMINFCPMCGRPITDAAKKKKEI